MALVNFQTAAALTVCRGPARARTVEYAADQGSGSGDAGLVLDFKLLTQADKRWQRLNSAHHKPNQANG